MSEVPPCCLSVIERMRIDDSWWPPFWGYKPDLTVSSHLGHPTRGCMPRTFPSALASHTTPCMAAVLVVIKSEFFIDDLLVRIHFIIVMVRWTGLAPWSLISLFQVALHLPSKGSKKRLSCTAVIDSGLVGRKVPRGENMLYSGADPETYITEYTSVYEDNRLS